MGQTGLAFDWSEETRVGMIADAMHGHVGTRMSGARKRGCTAASLPSQGKGRGRGEGGESL